MKHGNSRRSHEAAMKPVEPGRARPAFSTPADANVCSEARHAGRPNRSLYPPL